MSLKWQEIVVSFFYLGRSPIAPGTVGALAAMIILILLEIDNMIHLSLMISLCYVGGLKAAPWCEKEFGKDPSIFVIDEVVGYWVAVLVFWIGNYKSFLEAHSDPSLIVLFILFRFFDITKIGPVKKMEEIEGGHGILLDDVVAGIFAGVVALAIFHMGLI